MAKWLGEHGWQSSAVEGGSRRDSFAWRVKASVIKGFAALKNETLKVPSLSVLLHYIFIRRMTF